MKNFFNQIASVIIIFFCVHHFWRARPGAASVKRWEIGRRPGTDWSWKTKSWDIWLTCISLSQSHTVTKLSYQSSVIQQPAPRLVWNTLQRLYCVWWWGGWSQTSSMATLSIDPAYLVNQAHFDQLYTHLSVNFGHGKLLLWRRPWWWEWWWWWGRQWSYCAVKDKYKHWFLYYNKNFVYQSQSKSHLLIQKSISLRSGMSLKNAMTSKITIELCGMDKTCGKGLQEE